MEIPVKTTISQYLLVLILVIAACSKKPGNTPGPSPTPDTQAPTVPTGLAVTGTTTSSISISWNASTDNVGVKGYTVYRNGNQITQVMSGTAYTDNGLTASTSYTYKVSAFDAANNASAQSSEVTGTTGAVGTPPVVTSTYCATIEGAMAKIKSTVSSDGGLPVTQRGICWGTSPDPTIANLKTTDGSGTGNFESTAPGLNATTRYYMRAYAINSAGISYGNTYSFTPSSLNAPSAIQILCTGAIIRHNSSVVGSKICWSTIADDADTLFTSLPVWDGSSMFIATMPNLLQTTTYHVRSYFVHEGVVKKGSSLPITTLTPTGPYFLGQSTGGGVIFWVSTDANKALVAGTSDINPGVGLRWWPQGGTFFALGATNDNLGGGDVNTNLIATHPQCLPDAAARRCYDLVQGGFTDWYLPNKVESEQLYLNRNLPGLSGTFITIPGQGQDLWTSLETVSVTSAWMHGWTGTGIGAGGANVKSGLAMVRAIRKIGNW